MKDRTDERRGGERGDILNVSWTLALSKTLWSVEMLRLSPGYTLKYVGENCCFSQPPLIPPALLNYSSSSELIDSATLFKML